MPDILLNSKDRFSGKKQKQNQIENQYFPRCLCQGKLFHFWVQICMHVYTYISISIYLYLFIIFLVQCKHSIKIETAWHGGKGADLYLHWLVLVWTTHLACDFMLGGGVCQNELTLLQKVTKTKIIIIITVNLENTFRNIF